MPRLCEQLQKLLAHPLETLQSLLALQQCLNVWKAYYSMTEARLYLADHDLEGSAQAGKEALKMAKAMHSQIEVENVRSLYHELSKQAFNNPYVCNLGVELGIF